MLATSWSMSALPQKSAGGSPPLNGPSNQDQSQINNQKSKITKAPRCQQRGALLQTFFETAVEGTRRAV